MHDKHAADEQLREAAARFLASCAGASDAQWCFRPALGSWSMAQVLEHVAISNQNIERMLSKRLLASPIDGRAPDVADAEIPFLFYRGDEPPGVAAPTGEWTDRSAAAGAFEASVRTLLEWSDGASADLRSVGLAHPVFGLLDGVQWLLFAASHIERHRSQLIGIARHRDFPA